MKKIVMLLIFISHLLFATLPSKESLSFSEKDDFLVTIIPFYSNDSEDIYLPIISLKEKNRTTNISLLKQKIAKNPSKVDPYYHLAVAYLHHNNKEISIEYLKKIIEIFTSYKDNEYRRYILKIYFDMINIYQYFEDYSKLEPLYKELEVLIKNYDNLPIKASILDLIGEHYYRTQNYKKSQIIYEKSLRVFMKFNRVNTTKEIFKISEPIYRSIFAQCYLDLAKVKIKNKINPIEDFDLALKLILSVYPEEDWHLYDYYRIYGHYLESINYRKALKIFDKALRVKDIQSYKKGHILTQKALIYLNHIDTREAIKLFDKAIKISDNYINIYNNRYLSEAYIKIGNYKKAYEKKSIAMDLTIEALKKYNTTHNYSQNNAYDRLKKTLYSTYSEIGYIAYLLGDYRNAIKAYSTLLKIEKNSDIYLKIGKLYHTLLRNEFQKPQTQLTKEGDVIFSDLMKEQHAYALGNYLEALKLNKNNSVERATIYMELAFLKLIFTKNDTTTFSYLEKAEKILKKEFKEDNINFYKIYSTRYFLYTRLKKYKLAYINSQKSFNIFLNNRSIQFSQLPFVLQRDNLQKSLINLKDLFKSFNNYKNKFSRANKKTFFNLWLRYKGEITNSQVYISALKAKTVDRETLDIIDEFELLQRDIKEQDREKTKKLKELEEKLSSKAYDYKISLKLKDIDSSKISKKLLKNELYMDFAKVDSHYYLFTLDKRENVTYHLIHADIDKLIKRFRESIIKFGEINDDSALTVEEKNRLSRPYQQVTKKLSNRLYKLLIEDTIPHISKYNKLIISPDGALNILPFEALEKGDKYLIQTKKIIYISSGKEFLKLKQNINKKPLNSKKIVVFSNPKFDDEEIDKSSVKKNIEMINPLDSLKTDELKVIKHIYGNQVEPFTNSRATKSNLFKVVAPSMLHLSTHSVYLQEDNSSKINPLSKSVLALANFNYVIFDGNYTGVFTASDFSTLNLYNTELVFFSSCQSGLGDTFLSEGTYGFNRASKLAGAKRVISAIWSVSATASEVLIDKFYRKLKASKNRKYTESLRESKKEMINSKEYHHPFYWAGFLENGI